MAKSGLHGGGAAGPAIDRVKSTTSHYSSTSSPPAALSSSAYHRPARFPLSLSPFLPLPLSLALSLFLCRYPQFHYPPSCSLYYRTAAQASPYIVNMSGTSKRARAHPHKHTPPRTRGYRRTWMSACASGYARALSPRQCTASVCDVIKPPVPTPFPLFLPPLAESNHPRPPSPHQPSRSLSAFLSPQPPLILPGGARLPWLTNNCRRPTWPPLISA